MVLRGHIDRATLLKPLPGAGVVRRQVVVLEEDDQSILFAGDASQTERLMIDGVADGVSPDAEAARSSLRRIQEFARQRRVV